MEWIVKIVKCIKPVSYAIILLSITILTTLLIANISFLQAIYNLYDEVAFPQHHNSSNIIVVSGYSMAPFTSIISIEDIEKCLTNTSGVKRIVYEVLSIVNTSNSTVVVRGISRDDLRYLVNYSIVEGSDLIDECMHCVWISEELANRYNIDIGDYIIVHSLFTSSPYILEVKGILDLDGPYSHELIVPIELGRAIRGIGDDKASIAIISLDQYIDKSIILGRFNVASEKVSLFERALIVLKYSGGRYSPTIYSSATEFYMARLGLHRDVFLIVSISIIFLMAMSSYIIGDMIVLTNRDNLSILYIIGLSKCKIKIVIIVLMLVTTMALFPIVSTASKYLFEIIGLKIMEYTLTSNVDILILIITFVSTYIFMVIGALSVDLIVED